MKTICSFLLLILITSHTVFSNDCTIKGKVTNTDTQNIAGARIELMDSSGRRLYAFTDTAGIYTIDNLQAGIWKLVCTHPLYKDKTATIIFEENNIKREFNFELDKDAAELNTVVVTGSKYSQKLYEQTVSMSIYSIGTYRNRRHADISNIPGTRYKPSDSADKKFYDEESSTQYGIIKENGFEKVVKKPLSTISIDVDVASYSFVRSFLTKGTKPPKGAVRLEEMVNYFNYDYPEPKDTIPFSICGEIGPAPWNPKHKLVHIGIQGRDIAKENLAPSNLVFLIDVSGSMQGPQGLDLVKKSLRILVNELNERDNIAIVVYAGASGLVLPSTSCNNKDLILKSLDKLEAGGSTAGAAGISLAYKIAQQNFIQQGNNRVILCTDGDFNVGITSDSDLISLIEEKRKSGVFLSVLGFGWGNVKDHKMEQLADKGNGNYAFIDDDKEAKKVLIEEMGGTLLTIAKDVKIQIEFNPDKVKAYRLLGYENRILNNEDFNDDSKDAGEIGAGAGVTAIYELITDSAESGSLIDKDSLKYTTTTNSKNIEKDDWLTIKIRYKDPNKSKSKLTQIFIDTQIPELAKTSDNFRFSAAVASFGMLLRESRFKGNFSYPEIIKLSEGALGRDSEGYRKSFIEMVRTALDKGTL